MSRAFVREDDGAGERLPDLPISPQRNYVTAAGLAQIEAKLARLQLALVDAADDRAVRASVERDLRYWRARRASAEVVAPPAGVDEVRFGSTVDVRQADGRRQTWRIVGEDEADPAQGLLPYTAPGARGLIGRGVGDAVEIAGNTVEIVGIR